MAFSRGSSPRGSRDWKRNPFSRSASIRCAHLRIGECEHRCAQLEVVEADVDVRAREHRFRKRLLDAIEGDETQLVPEGARGIEVRGR